MYCKSYIEIIANTYIYSDWTLGEFISSWMVGGQEGD